MVEEMKLDQDDRIPGEARQVLKFWYGELEPEQWWKRDDGVDAAVTSRFGVLYEQLAAKIPDDWLNTPNGRLAAVIVLDQFPRNMFRGDARSFATDASALELASETIASGDDMKLEPEGRSFLYMPYQHSEDPQVQARSVELFTALGNEEQLDFAIRHKEIIDRFGRFPHRNEMLGRESTEEEIEFLKEPGLFW